MAGKYQRPRHRRRLPSIRHRAFEISNEKMPVIKGNKGIDDSFALKEWKRGEKHRCTLSQMNMQTRFLQLPAEIRNQIYEYCQLSAGHRITYVPPEFDDCKHRTFRGFSRYGLLNPLSQVCRQIRYESGTIHKIINVGLPEAELFARTFLSGLDFSVGTVRIDTWDRAMRCNIQALVKASFRLPRLDVLFDVPEHERRYLYSWFGPTPADLRKWNDLNSLFVYSTGQWRRFLNRDVSHIEVDGITIFVTVKPGHKSGIAEGESQDLHQWAGKFGFPGSSYYAVYVRPTPSGIRKDCDDLL
jgi:hypothetical protein